MSQQLYRYQFELETPVEDIEAALLLAFLATESLHGESQTRLDASHHLDLPRRCCIIDASTAVGQDVNRLFTGFLRREFGEGAFTVERVTDGHPSQPKETRA